jgi:hypothetical protein
MTDLHIDGNLVTDDDIINEGLEVVSLIDLRHGLQLLLRRGHQLLSLQLLLLLKLLLLSVPMLRLLHLSGVLWHQTIIEMVLSLLCLRNLFPYHLLSTPPRCHF